MPTTQAVPVAVPLSNPFDTLRAKWSARQARKRALNDRLAAGDAELGSRLDGMDRSGS